MIKNRMFKIRQTLFLFGFILTGALGAFFIFTSPTQAASYSAFKIIQSHRSIDIVPSKGFTFKVGFKNTGTQTWYRDSVSFVSLYTDSDRENDYYHPFWYSKEQPAILAHGSEEVKPGQIGYLRFALQAPDEEGDFPAKFRLAAEDTAWINGGVLDIVLHVRHPEPAAEESSPQITQTPEPASEQEPQEQTELMRVALQKVINPTEFTSSEDINFFDDQKLITTIGRNQNTKVIHNGRTSFTVEAQGKSYQATIPRFTSDNPDNLFIITSFENRLAWNPALNDNVFKGSIELQYSQKSKVAWLINELLLEDYLQGVAELGNSYPQEYVKALALASRTYAVYHLSKGGKYADEPFHLKNSVNGNGDDQIYHGHSFTLRARAADGHSLPQGFADTKGEIITYNDNPIIAAYSTDSGGRAVDARELWSRSFYQNHPYLWGVHLNGQPVLDPASTVHNASQRAASHGVGMSGVGARQMAAEGASYQDIIKHYYPGVTITQ